MRRLFFAFFALAAMVFSFSSCATIIGGAQYTARVRVPDHPNAKISINGQYRGTGEVTAMIKRKEANQLNITVQEGNDEPQTTVFSGRKFRGGAFIADLFFGWLGPVPLGIIIDAATGSWWKPRKSESGVRKESLKQYTYTINYQPGTPKQDVHDSPKATSVPQEANPNPTIQEPTPAPTSVAPSQTLTKTKTEALRELKQLLDEGILTQEEYEKEKAKILQSN